MCGRYVSPTEAAIEIAWNAKPRDDSDQFQGRFNAAPTLQLPVIRGADREIAMMRWGLIPAWSKDGTLKTVLNNARAETIAEKPSYRSAFRRHRCIVPMLGFYEWQVTPSGKRPHYISDRNAEQLAVAGIWEHWAGNADKPGLDSFAVITIGPNSLMEKIHDRMPVILAPKEVDYWLNPENRNPEDLQEHLRPCPSDWLQVWQVSTRVNSTRNEGADLVEPS